jgi:hypothetical protein
MDGQVTRCASCGASVTAARFCTHCGAELGNQHGYQLGAQPGDPLGAQPSAQHAAPSGPAYDDTSTHERIPVVPAAPRHLQPAPTEPASTEPAPTEPAYPQPAYLAPIPGQQPAAPTSPRRSPGAGLWVAAAACLLVVLAVGAFLLLSGGGGNHSSSSSPRLLPRTHDTSTAPTTSAPTASAPTSPTTSAASPHGPAADVAGLSHASAPRHAPAGVDFAGRPVTYVASNMVDGAADTCWRTPGDASGIVLTFRLDQPTVITGVGLINGYAKTVYPGGRRFDWYHGDRRVLSVDWIFDDGTTVSQSFSDTPSIQTISVDPVTTSTVRVRITRVSTPGHGPAARDDTPVSEVSIVGRTA